MSFNPVQLACVGDITRSSCRRSSAFMPFPWATPQGVDGGPSPAMTMGGARLATDDAVIPGRALTEPYWE